MERDVIIAHALMVLNLGRDIHPVRRVELQAHRAVCLPDGPFMALHIGNIQGIPTLQLAAARLPERTPWHRETTAEMAHLVMQVRISRNCSNCPEERGTNPPFMHAGQAAKLRPPKNTVLSWIGGRQQSCKITNRKRALSSAFAVLITTPYPASGGRRILHGNRVSLCPLPPPKKKSSTPFC